MTRSSPRLLVGILSSLLLVLGCGISSTDEPPTLDGDESLLLGEAPALKASGLVPGEPYTLMAESEDAYGRLRVAEASFVADSAGVLDPSLQAPFRGSYSDIDAFGLLWSAEMPSPLPDDWQAPPAKDFHRLRFRLLRDGVEIASREMRQWIRPPGVRSEVPAGGLQAELYLPPSAEESLPALVLLGGSGGGRTWASSTAALLAQKGYAALALAYFNAEGLPEHLAQVPIEPVFEALDLLASDPRIDPGRLGLVGYSKGAELALVVASRRPDVSAVVAIAPGSAVFQGFKPPKYPTLSSWSFAGKDLDFVPNAYDEYFFATFDGMYLWYRTLAQHEEMAKAAIPVEAIQGDLLLLSGVEDRIWPATRMAEQIVARLHLAAFEHEVHHLAFPRAGHGIAAPPGDSTTAVAERLGGTAAGNARARADGWLAIEEFLASSLR